MNRQRLSKVAFLALLILSAFPFMTTSIALVCGILFSLIAGNPWPEQTTGWSKKLLQISVIGLGFGLSLGQVYNAGKSAVIYTIIGIIFTLLTGKILGKLLKTNANTSVLISFGTAICGGSAIAAIAPVIKAKNEEVAISLATIFTLNSVGLLLYPYIGHLLHLSQRSFGLWAAIGIHDTSSVVGAAAVYGSTALSIATTVKLTRAFWIAPLALGKAWLSKSSQRAKIPAFIIGFVLAATIRSVLPQLAPLWNGVSSVAKQSLVVTLFLIGSGLTKDLLKKVGFRPLAQATVLWVMVSGLTLFSILRGWIH